MNAPGLLDELRAAAGTTAANLQEHFSEALRPRVAALLQDAAVVEIRAASGEDVGTARAALQASLANLTREEKAVVTLESRALALRVVVAVLGRLAG